jgi:hypothetical protein
MPYLRPVVAMTPPPSIVITLEAEHLLTVEECFPDGEPDSWTAADIFDALKEQGVSAWMLDAYGFHVRVSVTKPNEHFGQAESLLPGHAPERWTHDVATGHVK